MQLVAIQLAKTSLFSIFLFLLSSTIVQFCTLLYHDLTKLYIILKQGLGLMGSAFKESGLKFLVRPFTGDRVKSAVSSGEDVF